MSELISREEVLTFMIENVDLTELRHELSSRADHSKAIYAFKCGYNCAVDAIANHAPTIEAEPVKHAYMLTDEDGNIKCSNCGSSECWGNYCMNCGAKMDGVEE